MRDWIHVDQLTPWALNGGEERGCRTREWTDALLGLAVWQLAGRVRGVRAAASAGCQRRWVNQIVGLLP